MSRNSLVFGGAMLLLVGALAIWATRPASPVATTPIASASAPASASPTAAPTPSPTTASPRGTFESRILGYRITLPVAYRLVGTHNRMYVLSHLNAPSSQRLADIAASFSALPPLPFPTAPPAQIARDAASNLGQRLAQAFAAKDADAVAGLMTDCRISAGANIGAGPNGSGGA